MLALRPQHRTILHDFFTKQIFFLNSKPGGVKLLPRLRPGLSHLCEHKFKHGFQDSLNPI